MGGSDDYGALGALFLGPLSFAIWVRLLLLLPVLFKKTLNHGRDFH